MALPAAREAESLQIQAHETEPPRPFGITALSIFFIFGAAMAFTAAVSLILPGSPLELMWRFNPRARAEFRDLGLWAAALMLVVSVGCATSAIGLWRGAPWGRVVALGMLAIHMVGDTVNVLLGFEPRAVLGIPIAGLLIAYLLSGRVRRFFVARKVEP